MINTHYPNYVVFDGHKRNKTSVAYILTDVCTLGVFMGSQKTCYAIPRDTWGCHEHPSYLGYQENLSHARVYFLRFGDCFTNVCSKHANLKLHAGSDCKRAHCEHDRKIKSKKKTTKGLYIIM